jgi:hypothetical protein
MELRMRKSVALGTIMALGLGGQAFAAEGFSYNNIEASYVDTEIAVFGGQVDGDGFGLSGSLEFSPSAFGFVSLNDIDYEAGLSSQAFSVGVGFNWALNPDLDLVSGVSFDSLKAKISGIGSATDEGYGLNIGLRGHVGEALELTGNVKYTDLGHGLDGTTLSVTGRYYFTPAFAGGIDISDNEDDTTFGVALRYDFGKRY